MDTVTHLMLGATLAGLSYVDPAVAHNANLAQAVLMGTLIGSHAPDLDSVIRVKGFASYIKFHRGITHSVPALFVWPAIITMLLGNGFGLLVHWPVLFIWTFLAVAFHVFLDTMNSYGVQSARPFSKQWVHWDILAIFEPFLFLLHGTGLMMWLWLGYDPARLFPWIYTITFGYISLRSYQHRILMKRVSKTIAGTRICHVFPGFRWFHWSFVAELEDCYYTGKIVYHKLFIEEVYPKEERNAIIRATMGVDGVRAFLGFAQRIHVTCKKVKDGYEVSWSDVRFFQNRKLPFGVDVRLDQDMKVVSQKLGWRKKAWEPPFV
jgi:inner membrane protein